MMRRLHAVSGAGSMLALMLLAGCGQDEAADVRQWMEETKRQTPVKIADIAEPKKFLPFVYGGKDSPDPYDPAKLATALAKLQANASSAVKPDLERPREPLEQYPLDTLKMVGTLHKAGRNYALLQSDRTVFQIKVGNYIGQNFGLVTAISESGIDLKEIVQDASGEWVERPAKLELQETKK